MIIDHPAFFFHALANGKWSSTARLSLYIYKKNVPARQSLQSIQVTYTFKQTNCFALPGYIQINILPVTCNMHTSTRKLATPKQTTTTTNILCMFLSPMLLTCLNGTNSAIILYTSGSLSIPATTELTSCQANWHLNHRSFSGRIAAKTELTMRLSPHLPPRTHNAPTGTAVVIEGP